MSESPQSFGRRLDNELAAAEAALQGARSHLQLSGLQQSVACARAGERALEALQAIQTARALLKGWALERI